MRRILYVLGALILLAGAAASWLYWHQRHTYGDNDELVACPEAELETRLRAGFREARSIKVEGVRFEEVTGSRDLTGQGETIANRLRITQIQRVSADVGSAGYARIRVTTAQGHQWVLKAYGGLIQVQSLNGDLMITLAKNLVP